MKYGDIKRLFPASGFMDVTDGKIDKHYDASNNHEHQDFTDPPTLSLADGWYQVLVTSETMPYNDYLTDVTNDTVGFVVEMIRDDSTTQYLYATQDLKSYIRLNTSNEFEARLHDGVVLTLANPFTGWGNGEKETIGVIFNLNGDDSYMYLTDTNGLLASATRDNFVGSTEVFDTSTEVFDASEEKFGDYEINKETKTIYIGSDGSGGGFSSVGVNMQWSLDRLVNTDDLAKELFGKMFKAIYDINFN